MSSIPRVHRRTLRLLLLAGVILMSGAITQCKMVTDTVTRPQVDLMGAGSCIKACSEAANAAIRAESELHTKNVKACGKDKLCKQAEADRHVAAVQAIQDQRKACQNGCHHQGGGKGR